MTSSLKKAAILAVRSVTHPSLPGQCQCLIRPATNAPSSGAREIWNPPQPTPRAKDGWAGRLPCKSDRPENCGCRRQHWQDGKRHSRCGKDNECDGTNCTECCRHTHPCTSRLSNPMCLL